MPTPEVTPKLWAQAAPVGSGDKASAPVAEPPRTFAYDRYAQEPQHRPLIDKGHPMRTRGREAASILVVGALLVLTGCGPGEPKMGTAPPTTDQPIAEPSITYQVQSLTKDNEPVDITGWTDADLPDTLVGGVIRPGHVCNNPGFEITAVDGDVWTTVKTDVESAEGCGAQAQAVKDKAVATLEGQLTVHQTDEGIEITNLPYRLMLEPTK